MRLCRVRLSGFKTFAARTEAALDPGVTAVVGPNGSGKSNLVDAIRWALGETNARELRGARMDEVIYSGGRGRAPMGIAQVELILDNQDGRLPVDDTEVSIARRVTRNGDSEYRLNGSRVRLRDLERLLTATGLTQSGYSVVAQNDVDGVIEATPAQRRSLVEEAAGVRGLRASREDAIGRVAATETRLLRLTDLLAEAEPRLAELESQVEAALEQRRLVGRLGELRGSLAREAWRAARVQARRARARVTTALARADAAREAEAGFASRLQAEDRRLAAARAAQRAAAERLEQTRLAAERAAGDLRRWADGAATAGLARAAAGAEWAAATDDAVAHTGLIEELGEGGAAAERLLAELQERLAVTRAAHRAAAGAADAAGRELAAAERELVMAQRRHATAATAARDHGMRAGLLEETAAGLVAEAAQARGHAAALAAEARAASERAAGVAEAAAAAESALAAVRTEAAGARELTVAARSAETAAHTAGSEAAARAAAVRGRLEGALGGGAVAAAVSAGRIEGVRLVERVRVLDAADEAAVEAALEQHLAAWLVADLQAARVLLAGQELREEVLAAGLEVLPATPAPPGARRAAAAVEASADAAGALAHCLDGVVLVADLAAAAAALAAGARRCVLPDGTVAGPAGVRGGGRPGATMALAGAEREAAAAAAAAGEGERAATAAAERATAVLREVEARASAAASELDRARSAAAAAEAAAASTAAASRAEEERAAALDTEGATRLAGCAAAREAATTAATEEERAVEALTSTGEVLERARARTTEERGRRDRAEVELRAQELDLARAEPRARELRGRAAAARQAFATARARADAAALRRLAAEVQALTALARRHEAAARRSNVAALLSSSAAELERVAGPVAEAEAAVAALAAERADVAVLAARAADEHAAARAELAACEARIDQLAEAVREDDCDEGPEPEADAAERAEREITRLERRVAALGPVNALAPEQHAALLARLGRLRADHHDLASACRDLRALAAVLSDEIERRFEAVFGAVAYHFHLLFAELFPGGRATLRFQTPAPVEDAAEASGPERPAEPEGIEILAQPPGKRLQALRLLSGGERALTALALILAVQQVNPSPFCVFDEVDAPLDDPNVVRFTRLLRRLAATQQFLVVTHNQATMAAADVLYGVTSNADGTSRLLSVRLEGGRTVPQPEARAVEAAVAAMG
jgi:chromosome segregation protein